MTREQVEKLKKQSGDSIEQVIATMYNEFGEKLKKLQRIKPIF